MCARACVFVFFHECCFIFSVFFFQSLHFTSNSMLQKSFLAILKRQWIVAVDFVRLLVSN